MSGNYSLSRRSCLLAAAGWLALGYGRKPLAETADEGNVYQSLAGGPAGIETYTGSGRWALGMIWSVDCAVCEREAPTIEAYYREQKNTDVTVFGINLDGEAQRQRVKTFLTEHDLTFPTLIAAMPAFAFEYEAATGERLLGTPTFLVFAPDGSLVANNPGPLRIEAFERYLAGKRRTLGRN